MKKNFLWAMVAATVLMSCNPDKDLTEGQDQVGEGNAVRFSTYVNKSRAGVTDTDHIKLHGFGVNAYYTKNLGFVEANGAGSLVTFMDNTKVSFNNEKGSWTYSPVKYWPNTENDKVSFFAYAPYNNAQIEFPDENNRSTLVFNVNSDVKQQVDLVYHKGEGDVEAGIEPSIDLQKPTITGAVNFNFLHALSRIAFNVKAVVDDVNADSDNLLDGNTHINIKKVALVSADVNYKYDESDLVGPFYTLDTLNILNGKWGHNDEQALQGFDFDGENFYRAVDINASSDIENDDVVQLTKFNPAQRLLNDDSYLMIIPQDFTGTEGYRIYIEYDVVTEAIDNNGTEENITSDASTISHKIYSDVMNTKFEAGKAYVFNLRLGMTSVKFDANVSDWPAEEEADNWTPENNI